MYNSIVLASEPQSMMPMLLMMVAVFAIMYFFMIRPQQKQRKEIQKFQNELQEGTQVITGGGIHGTIHKIDLQNGTVELKIARDVIITIERSYVFKDTASMGMQK